MKRIVLATLVAAAAVWVIAPTVQAGTETGPKVALHLTATTSKAASICTSWSPNTAGIPCSSYDVDGETAPSVVENQIIYMVVAQVDTELYVGGLAGLTVGIEYNGNVSQGVDVVSWTVCADGQEYRNAGPRGDWPAAGGGNVITWATCQTNRIGDDSIHGVVGAFTIYAYATDVFRVTPNRNLLVGPRMLVADCSAAETLLDTTVAAGWVGFGTKLGCNPCTQSCPVPVASTTWGKLKNLY